MTTTQKLSEIINAIKEYKESLNASSASYSISKSVNSASTCNFPAWYVDFVEYAGGEDCFKEEDKEKEQKERVDNIMNKYGLV